MGSCSLPWGESSQSPTVKIYSLSYLIFWLIYKDPSPSTDWLGYRARGHFTAGRVAVRPQLCSGLKSSWGWGLTGPSHEGKEVTLSREGLLSHWPLRDAWARSGWRPTDETLRSCIVQALWVSGEGRPPQRRKAERKGQKGRRKRGVESLRAHTLESSRPGFKSWHYPLPAVWPQVTSHCNSVSPPVKWV